MDFQQLQTQLNQKLNEVSVKINNFSNFFVNKLKNFKNLTLGEQISFGIIGGGFVLILISIVLFII